MLKKLRRMVDRTFICYIIIGILNFLFCTALMFLLFLVHRWAERDDTRH